MFLNVKQRQTRMDINNGTGHFSGDDTFIRDENKENKQLFKAPPRFTKKQQDESDYYLPCSICGKTIMQINKEGCPRPGCIVQS